MLLRRHFSVPTGTTSVHLTGVVLDTEAVYVNGTLVATASHGIYNPGGIDVDIPVSDLSADNVLAVRGEAQHDSSTYMDLALTVH